MYRITNKSEVDGVNVTVGDALLSIPPAGFVDLDVVKADVAHLPAALLEVTRITKAEAEKAATARAEAQPGTQAQAEAATDDSDDQDDAGVATEEES